MSKNNEININGIAKPSAYKNNKIAPLKAVDDCEAIMSKLASIGPMQGAHPIPKVIPKRKEPKNFLDVFCLTLIPWNPLPKTTNKLHGGKKVGKG